MIYVDCNRIIYQRYPYDSAVKSFTLRVLNPNGGAVRWYRYPHPDFWRPQHLTDSPAWSAVHRQPGGAGPGGSDRRLELNPPAALLKEYR
ncbi:MAG: hypothetical protein MZV70_41255 [Desulfobacterales bacterium]|nr:hypothetical protein [Desulfobacterales bacterium]